MIIFGTGHRPEDAGMELNQMVELAEDEIIGGSRGDISAIISGMAAGFDLAIGLVAMRLFIPLWCAKPWAGHQPRKIDREIYEELESCATRIISVNDSWTYPGPWVYQDRNVWMVNQGDEGIALWNGKKSGGTYNCLQYAEVVGKPVTNVYPKRRNND